MKLSRWKKPYINGKANGLYQYNGLSGLYFIKEYQRIRYVGKSNSNLYVTFTNHFPTKNRKEENQIRHFYCRNNPAIRAKFLLCPHEKIHDLEIYFINKFDPCDNFKDKLYFALKNPYLRKVIKEQLYGLI